MGSLTSHTAPLPPFGEAGEGRGGGGSCCKVKDFRFLKNDESSVKFTCLQHSHRPLIVHNTQSEGDLPADNSSSARAHFRQSDVPYASRGEPDGNGHLLPLESSGVLTVLMYQQLLWLRCQRSFCITFQSHLTWFLSFMKYFTQF